MWSGLFVPWWCVVVLGLLFAVQIRFHSVFMSWLVFFSVLQGATKSRRTKQRNLRLHAFFCETHLLDATSVLELFTLLTDLVKVRPEHQSLNTPERFQQYMLKHSHVVIYRDSLDGSLRGMFLIDFQTNIVKDNYHYNRIQMGSLMFRPECRGGPFLYLVVILNFLKILLRHPCTPLLITGKLYSSKLYMLGARTMKLGLYPRYDAETPSWIKSVLDELGRAEENFPGEYDEDTGVLKREYSSLQDHATADHDGVVTDSPHAQFFTERNPGWKKGHCLLCVICLTWGVLFSFCKDALMRMLRSSGVTSRRRRTLKRRSTSKRLLIRSVSSLEMRQKSLKTMIEYHKRQKRDGVLKRRLQRRSTSLSRLLSGLQTRRSSSKRSRGSACSTSDEEWQGVNDLVYGSPTEMTFDQLEVDAFI